MSNKDYMKKAEDRIREERQRARNYLDPCTQPRQMQIVQDQLVQAHAKTLVEMKNSGAVAMFQDDKVSCSSAACATLPFTMS